MHPTCLIVVKLLCHVVTIKPISDPLAETVSDSDDDPGASEHDGTSFDVVASLTRLRERAALAVAAAQREARVK